MKTEPAFLPILEHEIQLMKKQLKRDSEFSRFLPFADQQRELDAIVNRLHIEVGRSHRTFEICLDSGFLMRAAQQ